MLQILRVGGEHTDREKLEKAVDDGLVAAKRTESRVKWCDEIKEVDRRRLVAVVGFAGADLSQVNADPLLQDRVFGLHAPNKVPPRDASTLWLETGGDWCSRLTRCLLRFLEIDPDRRPRVFISYRHVDGGNAAAQLEDHLTTLGFRVFHDRRELEVGDRLRAKICEALADTDVLIRLLTPKASDDPASWMRWEAEAATLLGAGAIQVVWPGRTASSAVRSITLGMGDVETDQRLGSTAVKRIGEMILRELAEILTFRRARLAEGLIRLARSAGQRATCDLSNDSVVVTTEGGSQRRAPRPGTYRPLPGLPGSRAYRQLLRATKDFALVDGAACSADDGHEFWLQTVVMGARVFPIDLVAEARSGWWVFHDEPGS